LTLVASTEAELARLAADGVPIEQLIWTAYYFSHFGSSQPERRAFRQALEAAGFTKAGMDTEGYDDHYWHHWSHTFRRADPEQLRAADRLAAEIAAAHGVQYDEWEVVRHEQDGTLRPATE
jgi:hypothetical protein